MTSQKAEQKAGGPHYSPFVVGGGLIFVSGQLPLLPGRDTSLATASFALQAEQVLRNLKAVLADAGAELAQVVKTTVYLADIDDWGSWTRSMAAFSVPCVRHGRLCRQDRCISVFVSRSTRSRWLRRRSHSR